MLDDNSSFLTELVIAASRYQSSSSDKKNNLNISTKTSEYFLSPQKIIGDISDIYFGYRKDSTRTPIVLKLIRNTQDNDLAQNEARSLIHLHSDPGPQVKHLPKLLDKFKTNDDKLALIISQFDGIDLKSIRKNPRYVSGVPDFHVAWILCRLLSVLGYVHSRKTIHCNLDPSHILISPENHNLCLIDWSYSIFDSVNTHQLFKANNKNFSPPEVLKKRIPLPSADLYSAGKCMIYLLGGDIKTNKIPNSVDLQFQQFIRYFLLPSPYQRPQDAWKMYNQLVKLRTKIWGEKEFLRFET